MDNYEKWVRAYESKGCTRSDAQAVIDAEDMNKGRHTPGKWEAKPATLNIKDPLFYKADVISGGIRVAHVAGVGEETANANARLIAAAPEMLEACKAMLSWHEAHYTELMPVDTHFNKNSMLNKARHVIAKAEGK